MTIPLTVDVLISAAEYWAYELLPLSLESIPKVSHSRGSGQLSSQEFSRLDQVGTVTKLLYLGFLLREVDCLEIGKEAIVAVVENTTDRKRSVEPGCSKQGFQADTTNGVPETLLMNGGGIKAKCSSSSAVTAE